jgi:hypothetical protein
MLRQLRRARTEIATRIGIADATTLVATNTHSVLRANTAT